MSGGLVRRLVRAVITWWHRNDRTPIDPAQPAPTLVQQRLERLHRVTRVALRFDLMWTTGTAAEHLEEFDREFLYHLFTCPDNARLFVQAAEQLEVQS